MTSRDWLKAELLQVLAAAFALLGGVFIYLLSRDSQHVYFLRFLPFLQSSDASQPGVFSNILPSLLHTYAFILLSVAVLSASLVQTRIICLVWVVIEGLFEAGQHERIAGLISEPLGLWLDGIPLLQFSHEYFVNGTFDGLDILAILLGAAAAYVSVMFSYALFHPAKPNL